jgi:ABC-type branched-subunit amino acid transport system substrate-binding protein
MKIRRASILVLLGLIELACSTASASDPSSPDDPTAKAQPDVIRVGYAHPLTGSFSKPAATFERTLRIAQEQINSNGGIRGKMLELVTKDTQSSGEVAGSIAQELVSSGVSSIITDDGTAPGLSMLGVTVPANAVLVFGAAQAISLSKPENNGLFFRPGSNTFDEAGPLTAAIVADGHARIAVLSSTIGYAASLYAEVEKTFLASTCAGAACEIAHHGTYPSDADFATFDFAPLVTEALASNPDALFVSSFFNDAKVLLKAIWDAGSRADLHQHGRQPPEPRAFTGRGADRTDQVGDAERPERSQRRVREQGVDGRRLSCERVHRPRSQ